jgi:hypothetical protein
MVDKEKRWQPTPLRSTLLAVRARRGQPVRQPEFDLKVLRTQGWPSDGLRVGTRLTALES